MFKGLAQEITPFENPLTLHSLTLGQVESQDSHGTVPRIESFFYPPPFPYIGLQLPGVPHEVLSNPGQARRQAVAASLCFRLSPIPARGGLFGVSKFKDGSDGAAELGTCVSFLSAACWDGIGGGRPSHPFGFWCVCMPAQYLLPSSSLPPSLPPALQYLVAYDLLSKNEDKLSTKDQNFGSHMTI